MSPETPNTAGKGCGKGTWNLGDPKSLGDSFAHNCIHSDTTDNTCLQTGGGNFTHSHTQGNCADHQTTI